MKVLTAKAVSWLLLGIANRLRSWAWAAEDWADIGDLPQGIWMKAEYVTQDEYKADGTD